MKAKPYRILTLCQGETPSTHIRLYLPLDGLVEEGAIEYRKEPLATYSPGTLHWADVVILQRLDSPQGLDVLELAQLYGKPVIYETDDNWVEPPPAYHPAHAHHSRLLVRNTVERYLSKADLITVSTEALRDVYQRFNEKICVIPNSVAFMTPLSRRNETGTVRIGYAGTRTHAGDFEAVAPALNRLCREFKDRIRLVFLGYVPEGLEKGGHIEEWGFTENYESYLQTLARLRIDMAIAPLQDIGFNRFKSNIKYLEYSSAGIAGIYSRCPAYDTSVVHGTTGLLADHNEEAWYEAVRDLLEKPSLRKQIVSAARKDVQERFPLDGAREAWREVFSTMLARVSGKKEDRRGASVKSRKKVFYIGAGFLWPHTYIDDLLVRAFSSLDMEVAFHPLCPTRFFEETLALYKNFDPKFREFSLGRAIEPDKLLQAIRREEPDLIFTVQGYMIPREVLYEISRTGIPSAVWLMDEPYDSLKSVDMGTFFTHVFVQDAATVALHRNQGNPRTAYLPHGFDPVEVHGRRGQGAMKWDVSLVGTGYPRRRQAIEALDGKGRTLVVGRKWDGLEKSHRLELTPVLSLEEAADVYRKSRINLNIHREEQDFAASSPVLRARSPNASLFYIAGCGGFQITDDSRSDVERFFVPGKEIVLFHDVEELKEKVSYFLRHEEERNRVREAAYRRACSEHTYKHRIRSLMDAVEEGRSSSEPRFHAKTMVFPFSRDRSNVPLGNDVQVVSFQETEERGVRAIRVPENADISSALNEALLHASSPYSVIAPPTVEGLREKVAQAVRLFSRNLDLGAVEWVTKESDVILLTLSSRILHKIGAFTKGYGSVDLALKDLLFRMKARSFEVQTMQGNGKPLTAYGEVDPKKREEDEDRFARRWGRDPETRLQAERLVRISSDLRAQGGEDEALALLNQALAMDPGLDDAHRELGSLLLQNGKPVEAEVHLMEAWSGDRDDVASGLMVALCLLVQKREKEALDLLHALQDKDACLLEKTSILYNMGRCHRRLGNPEEATRFLKQAIEIDPAYIRAQKELFAIFAESQAYPSALARLEKIIQLEPKNAEPVNDMGVILFTVGRKQEALEVLQRAVRVDRTYKMAYENLRLVAEDLGVQIDGAERPTRAHAC